MNKANTLTYKGYEAVIRYEPEDDEFHGTVEGIRDIIHFSGASVEELKKEMAVSVDTYLESCQEDGIDPDKPYSGKFVVRITPQAHKSAVERARAKGLSLNRYVQELLNKEDLSF